FGPPQGERAYTISKSGGSRVGPFQRAKGCYTAPVSTDDTIIIVLEVLIEPTNEVVLDIIDEIDPNTTSEAATNATTSSRVQI
nr:hypothetical protein [Tanacetum cinerariifolium]